MRLHAKRNGKTRHDREVKKGGKGSGAKRQAQTYGDAVDDWKGNEACVVFTPVMDRHQIKDGNRLAFSVCHAVSINVVKHDGANAKPCDSMQNGMERHGMAGKSGREGTAELGWGDSTKSEAGLTNSSNMFDISKNMFIFAPIKNQRITKSDRF
ncbi:MAG: hypothetical protein LKF06_08240 [Prevotella sp.]|nr:hypothetical protein [Prevotella sp.]MCH4018248.1 hypothetical protein [Prevotella sp.]MCH4100566.1 hypothetical protein [Prevotella sp.]MCI1324536.1 hypothetical protein [Prevotella sp.]MCI1349191.1 hypothetical protein [Prevotella sp.]